MTARVILLNDCGRPWHWGTRLVVEAIHDLARRHGVVVHRAYPAGWSRWDAEFDRALDRVDAVLINGEGTLHHDAPAGASLFLAAARARALGKPVVLMNTVWEANPGLARELRHVDLVFVRESLSRAALGRDGRAAEVVPDLSFGASLPVVESPGPAALVVGDSVSDDVTVTLARFARVNGVSCYPMRRWWGLLSRRPAATAALALAGALGRPLGPAHLPALAGARLVVTGRFHGACLAIRFGRPFVAIGSNTHKIEGLAADLGRPGAVVRPEEARTVADLSRLVGVAGDGGEAARASQVYVDEARRLQDEMFQRIAELARVGSSASGGAG